jgi:aminoglycoside phosphotransferase (APT) family kinase protein
VAPPDAAWSTEMADASGVQEVVCHNDICVENIVYRNQVAVAFLDFDFAAPGRRVHDLAQFARMCVPLDTDADAALLGRTPPFDPCRRVRIVADAYGLTAAQRPAFLEAIGEGIRRGGEFLQRRLDEGNEDFRRMVESTGGMAKFDRRRAWFTANHAAFAAALD